MKIKNIILFGIIGFVLGLAISVLSTYNVWLDMRLHAKHLVWASMLLGFLAGFKFKAKMIYFFSVETVPVILSFAGKLETVYCNFRETFFYNSSLQSVKPVFYIVIILCNLMTIILNLKLIKHGEKFFQKLETFFKNFFQNFLGGIL